MSFGVWILVALASVAALPADARAQVVLLAPPDPSDAVLVDTYNRVGAELQIHHFDSQSIELALVPDAASALGGAVRERDALAAIAFVQRDQVPTLQVWLVDRVSGEARLHTLSLSGGSDTPSLLAVRAVDLLRASQQQYLADEQNLPPPAAEPEPEPEPEPDEIEPPEPPAAPRAAWSLSASASLVWPGSEFGFALGPALGVRYRPIEWLRLSVLAGAPLLGSKLVKDRGSANMAFAYGLAEAQFVLLRVAGFELAPALGAGVFGLRASGEVEQPLEAQTGVEWSWLFTAGLSGELRLFSGVWLAVGARALLFAPELGVAVLNQSERLSSPTLEASLGVSVEL
jgi:hypothetical protein